MAALLCLPMVSSPGAELSDLDAGMTGPRAQVLVLGTVHLSGLPERFRPEALDEVLDRLAAFRPQVITIEALSGSDCETASRYAAAYADIFCVNTDVARAATGLDVPAALAAANALLDRLPSRPVPAQRRRLASLLLAANDRASAYVQWLQLPADERHAGDGLGESLVELLVQISGRRNENYQIAARLAARLGLQRVHAVDDHSGDNIEILDEAAFEKAMRAAWGTGREALDAREAQQQVLAEADQWLPLYRYINDPEHLRLLADLNATALLRTEYGEGYPRIWLAGWETRNLRMVANIREAFRQRPAARVLAIVGVSHKPWFDSWLGQMQAVDVVDAQRILE